MGIVYHLHNVIVSQFWSHTLWTGIHNINYEVKSLHFIYFWGMNPLFDQSLICPLDLKRRFFIEKFYSFSTHFTVILLTSIQQSNFKFHIGIQSIISWTSIRTILVDINPTIFKSKNDSKDYFANVSCDFWFYLRVTH